MLALFQGRFKGVSEKFHGRGGFKDVSRVFNDFQGCFQSVSRNFKKTFKMFEKRFMLHGTHHSFPSRRRACLYGTDFYFIINIYRV